MNVIRLDSNQTYDVPREGFSARLEFDLSEDLGFRVEVPSTETNRRGNTWWIRNPQGNTEVTVFPDGDRGRIPFGNQAVCNCGDSGGWAPRNYAAASNVSYRWFTLHPDS